MAYTPGILTHWPWEPLGSFKYVLVAPGVIHSIYLFIVKSEERSLFYVLTFPFMLWRMLHNQLWITLSRYRTTNGKNLIVDKSIEFDQVDRESNWDEQILFNWIIFYGFYWGIEAARKAPLWRMDGMVQIMLIHIGPVEFMYYWLHRALHHHFLYSRYHSHHHSSIVTQPITSVIHPFAEHILYYGLFSIPMLTTIITGTQSIVAVYIYITYIDFMNNLGHCNFELIPKWLFTSFPLLKYLFYTPSFHSLHHTRFRTNYSLFMPIYDYIYGTWDESTDTLYETTLEKQEDIPNVVHLTHLTTLQSIYHLRLGFASLASKPLNTKWYLWPLSFGSFLMTLMYGKAFMVEKNTFKNLKAQLWIIPRYLIHHHFQWQQETTNKMIEEAILEAHNKGVKVVSLGLCNQGKELNENGKIYLRRNPTLKVKVVDGSSLTIALVLNSIPHETTQVLFRGNISKVAYSIVSALCYKGIQVATIRKDEYEKLKKFVTKEGINNLIFSTKSLNHAKVWLVGEDLTAMEQSMAQRGTLFIPFSQFPSKKARKDCFYHIVPSMLAPKSFENLHSCENWLPRRVMSACRVAGIVHALEGWNTNECGDAVFDMDKTWEASLRYGFRPFLGVTQ
ncbi:very-long-chain aldehyde decarbonylase CER1-like [Amaranthus tricolor]|uniref:very-long-chain aldehyde decarbonylase CER1-like n=1 Tax=Amaranthus tricolor TaxID=29722 RepID=UPI002588A402|nr:very-long-chain aldehyde decarbonylase CER1-like [Amaranthus tricolor]